MLASGQHLPRVRVRVGVWVRVWIRVRVIVGIRVRFGVRVGVQGRTHGSIDSPEELEEILGKRLRPEAESRKLVTPDWMLYLESAVMVWNLQVMESSAPA